MKLNEQKESINMNEAPPSNNKINYNCSDCSSLIEIIYIDENKIEFKCTNNHKIKIDIKEYLNKMKIFNKGKLNDKMCNKHNKEYLVYCFDCNTHLCKECLKLGEHRYHYKINIIEIIPDNEALNKIDDLIKTKKFEYKKIYQRKIKVENKLNDILNNNIKKIKEKANINKENINRKEEEELMVAKNNYFKEIKKLRVEYENKLKNIRYKYNQNINNLRNKYKIEKLQNVMKYNKKSEELNKKIELKKESYKFKEEIERKSNFNELIEIIHNTYSINNNNYYNAININNIYNCLFNHDNNQEKREKEKIGFNENIIKLYEEKIREKENKIKDYEIKMKEKDIKIQDYENKMKQINIQLLGKDNNIQFN